MLTIGSEPQQESAAGADAQGVEVGQQAEAAAEQSGERELIAELQQHTYLPDWAARRFDRVLELRQYLEDDVYEWDDDSAVTINALGRMVAAKVGQLWPDRPACQVIPETQSGPSDERTMILREWAKVGGRLVNWFAEKALLEDDMQAGLYDVAVDGIAWLKCEWDEDETRDPLGESKNDDAQDQFERLRMLADQARTGEIHEGEAAWAELRELTEYYQDVVMKMHQEDPRAQAIGQALATDPPGLLPEPLNWTGPRTGLVPMENVRLDWDMVQSLEAAHKGRWFIEVSYQTPEQIAQGYELDEFDRAKLQSRASETGSSAESFPAAGAKGGGGTAEDWKEKDAEDEEYGEQIAVYTCWHRLNRRRYVWTPRLSHRFLENEIWRGALPFIPLAITHTPKRPIPISMALGGWSLQREINQTLREAKAARRARFPRYAVKRGEMDQEDLTKLNTAMPHAVVEVNDPEAVKNAIAEFRGAEYDPRLYDVTHLFRLLEIEVGVTMQQIGMSSSGSTATEVERAEAGAQSTSAMHSSLLHKALRRYYGLLLGYIAEYVTPEHVAWILGPHEAAIWGMVKKDRAQIAAGCKVDILAATNGPGAQKAHAEAWMQTADALARVAQSKVMMAQAGESLDTSHIYEAITEGMNLGIAGDELVRPLPPPEPGMEGGPGEAAAGSAAGLTGVALEGAGQ